MVKASPFPRSPRRYHVSKRRDYEPAKRPKRRGEGGGGGRDADRNVTRYNVSASSTTPTHFSDDDGRLRLSLGDQDEHQQVNLVT